MMIGLRIPNHPVLLQMENSGNLQIKSQELQQMSEVVKLRKSDFFYFRDHDILLSND
jgi:hypothetical protein